MEIEGRLVGLIETVPDDDLLLNENVAVRPALQKRGLDARPVGFAGALATRAGFGALRLYTNARFGENIRFYEPLSFVLEREAPLGGGVRSSWSSACDGLSRLIAR